MDDTACKVVTMFKVTFVVCSIWYHLHILQFYQGTKYYYIYILQGKYFPHQLQLYSFFTVNITRFIPIFPR